MTRIHQLPSEALAPLAVALRQSLRGELAVATPRPQSLLDLCTRRDSTASAWRDAPFLAELRQRNERLGVGEASRRQLEALASGEADCVIAGQQPGLCGGPILLAVKLAGTVALAAHLSTLSGRRIVPVYWCGSDDSDFEETTRTWLWSADGPYRVRLEDSTWEVGARVGGIDGAAIAALEERALQHGSPPRHWDWRADAKRLSLARDFGERAALWAELCFGGEGLVVVDARSPRLRMLGRDLFENYRRRHRELTELLRAHGATLQAQGLPAQLHDDALESGLFRLEGERRSKLAAAELEHASVDSLASSVLLRPLWQDSLLLPRAALLGPAELAYHAQIAPLYAALNVPAAAAIARPQLLTLPDSVVAADPRLSQDPRVLANAESWLSAHAFASREEAALQVYAAQLQEALARLQAALPALGPSALQATTERERNHVARLRESLLPLALASRGDDWQHLAVWYSLRGEAQERVYALAALWQRFGRDECGAMLHQLGTAFVAALEQNEPPFFLATMKGESS